MKHDQTGVRVFRELAEIVKHYHNILLHKLQLSGLDRYHEVLLVLDEHPEGLTQKSLAGLLKVDKTYLVTIIDYLAGHGFLRREKDQQDKRCHIVKLTAKSISLLPEIKRIIGDFDRACLEAIGDEELAAFRETLSKVQENLAGEKTHEILENYQLLQ